MTEVILNNVTLAYPMLGGGSKRRLRDVELGGAGAIIKDGGHRSRSIVSLSGISFHLHEGDRVGLIGRNGSGKSTLLRVVAGIYEPLEGTVQTAGLIGSLLSSGLGMRPEATGHENIELTGLINGLSKSEIAQRHDEIATFTELGEYLNMPVRTYSNGMAMRLKFACSTAFSPQILLMDEWLGAGDPSFQKKAREKLQRLVKQAGILMMASHNHNLISKECNKAIWLHKGEIRAYGPVDEVIYLHDKFSNAKRA